MTAASVPVSFDEFTPDRLTEILADAGIAGATVTGVVAERIAVGMARNSRLGRLTLTYAGDSRGAPRTLVAKLPMHTPHARAISATRATSSWTMEVLCYRHLIPTLEVTVPRCYYADSGPEPDRAALVLEDLSGHLPGDQVVGAGLPQATAAIGWLVGFHAGHWGRVDSTTFPWIPQAAERSAHSQKLIEDTWPQFCDIFADQVPKQALTRVENAISSFAELPGLAGSPETIAFGDYRLDNLMFAPGTFQPSVVDWSSPSVGPGMMDLGYFMAGSVPEGVRRDHEEELVAQYGHQLADRGVDVPAGPDLFDLYRYAMLRAASVIVMTARDLDMSNQRGLALSTTMVQRAYTAVHELWG